MFRIIESTAQQFLLDFRDLPMIKHRLMFRDLLSLDNFCRAEVATKCDLIVILVQFVSEKR